MAKKQLRVFEIDAIISAVVKAAEIHNKAIKFIGSKQVELALYKKYPKLKEIHEVRNEIERLTQRKASLERRFQDNSGISTNYNWMGILKEYTIEELQLKSGRIIVNQNDLRNDIILHGSEDLAELLKAMLSNLGLKQ